MIFHRISIVLAGLFQLAPSGLCKPLALSSEATLPRVVAITFDGTTDGTRTVLASTLLGRGFGATFYLQENEITSSAGEALRLLVAEGFELGVRPTADWTNIEGRSANFQTEYLDRVKHRFQIEDLPNPVTFAHPLGEIRIETLSVLERHSFYLARTDQSGVINPRLDHPLLLPSFNVREDLAELRVAIEKLSPGQLIVVRFGKELFSSEHGPILPDKKFLEFLDFLAARDCQVVALRELSGMFYHRIVSSSTRPSQLPAPFWQSRQMEREPLLFVQQQNSSTPTAHLLFSPNNLPIITNSSAGLIYEEGRDFHWYPGTTLIELLPGSRVPFITEGTLATLLIEGHYFHNIQTMATYRHDDKWRGAVPQGAAHRLTISTEKLRSAVPLSIVVLGDSISVGLNSSQVTAAWPLQPSYPRLVASALSEKYRSPITLTNLSVSGEDSDWGLTKAEEVAALKPDLVILAFGMNDASVDQGRRLASNLTRLRVQIRAAVPSAEFILISPISSRPGWNGRSAKIFTGYLAELKKQEGVGVAVADVTSIWNDLVARKGFASLTGNGVNHPNDFGHQIYAQVVLSALESENPTLIGGDSKTLDRTDGDSNRN